MSTETISGGHVHTQERYMGIGEGPNGAGYDHPSPEKPRLPSLDLEEPVEPDFSTSGWLETRVGDLADHPLLRGLLMELPPKGTTPPPGWLDRWFEATRSILELLYVDAGARR